MSTESNESAAKTPVVQPVNEVAGATVVAGKKVKAVPKSKAELSAETMRARGELAQTLDAIEYKLNVPRQMRVRSRLFTVHLSELGEKNPLALAGIVLGAVSALVGTVWLGVRAVQRR